MKYDTAPLRMVWKNILSKLDQRFFQCCVTILYAANYSHCKLTCERDDPEGNLRYVLQTTKIEKASKNLIDSSDYSS